MEGIKRFVAAIFLVFLLADFFQVYAQDMSDSSRSHRADQWVFGKNAHVDFRSNPPLSSFEPNLPEMIWSIASISDTTGSLLMFSDGINIYDSIYALIAGGDSLLGHPASTPAALFVPLPGDGNKYYLFTVDVYIPGYRENGINFSIIETGNGPTSVVSKNIPLLKENAQKICGVQHANGSDYWIVAHGLGSNKGDKLYAYLVSDTITQTVVSNDPINHTLDFDTYSNGVGGMKFSPEGSKLALVSLGMGLVELFDFNNETGSLTFKSASAPGQVPFANSIEFSPDGSKLYVSTTPASQSDEISQLIQYDLNNADPFSPAETFVLEEYPANVDSLMGTLQLAVDGKIYLSRYMSSAIDGKEYLGVIFNPDRPETASNYNHLNHEDNNGFYLNGGEGEVGLPAFVSSFLEVPVFSYRNQCYQDTSWFSITNTANIDATDWEFDDNAGTAFLNDFAHPGFAFSVSGDYRVELTEMYNGLPFDTYNEQVRIYPLPEINLVPAGIPESGQDSITVCVRDTVLLDAGHADNPPEMKYIWSNGYTGRYLNITSNDSLIDVQHYSVEVSNLNTTCSKSAEITVVFDVNECQTGIEENSLEIFPLSIHPNPNTGSFTIQTEQNIVSLEIQIINLAGTLVLEKTFHRSFEKGWDEMINLNDQPKGIYLLNAKVDGRRFTQKVVIK